MTVVEEVSAVAPLSDREVREEESTAQTTTTSHSLHAEPHDLRVEPGESVIILSPNTLLLSVWGRLDMRPTLLQPKAAVKADGDCILYSIQRNEFKMLWVDVCKVEHHINVNHINRYNS